MILSLALDSIMVSTRKIDNVESAIYPIRGQRVIVDSDLAEIYGVTTIRLNEQLRRNLKAKAGWATLSSMGFYRTWCAHAIVPLQS